MDDEKIINLYINRQEIAIHETDKKYGRLCNSISMGILNDKRDCEECISDTWLTLWNQIPPKRPNPLYRREGYWSAFHIKTKKEIKQPGIFGYAHNEEICFV